MRRATIATLATTALLVLSSCSDSPSGPGAVTTVTIASASQSQTLGAIGETLQLTATAKDAKGTVVGSQTFEWSSSNSSVATVANGLVTAVANGTATITAELNSISGTFSVTVQQVASQVVLTLAVDTIFMHGETAQATASVRDSKGSPIPNAPTNWNSSNTGVITVTGNGLLTAVSDGSATITASSGSASASKLVHVYQSSLFVATPPAGVRAGEAITTAPVIEIRDGSGNRITTDNATVITASIVSGEGTIVAGGTRTVSNGAATFTGLTIGGTAGNQVLKFSSTRAGSVEVPFTLAAGNPVGLQVFSGNNQTGLAKVALPQPLQAQVKDAFGNGVSGVDVAWGVADGDGTLQSATTATNASGVASNSFTLSRFAGANVAEASVDGVQGTAVFTATGTPNATVSGTVGLAANITSAGRASSTQSQPTVARALNAPATLRKATRNTRKQRSASSSAAAAQSATVQPTPQRYVPGELLVTYRADRVGAPAIGAAAYRSSANAAQLRNIVTEAIEPFVDAGVVQAVGVSPALLTARVRVAPGTSEADAMARIRQDPRVLAVERHAMATTHVVMPTSLGRALAHVSPVAMNHDSRAFASLLHPGTMMYPGGGIFPEDARYPEQSWHYNIVSLPRAWQITTGSDDIIVGIIDDGVRFDHPAMAGMLTNDGYDFVSTGTYNLCAGGTTSRNGDGDGYDPDPTVPVKRGFFNNGNCATGIENGAGHGLHVSGTIAMASNNFGLVGINRNVRMRMVRALDITGSGTWYDVAQAILYAAGLPADDGAGGTVAPATPSRIINMSLGATGFQTIVQTAVAQAQAAGVQIIASAGNNNNSQLTYPSSFPDVIAVSAVGPSLARANYSSFHSQVDIAAPGGNTSDGVTHGVYSSTWDFQTGTPSFSSYQGTSMAAPHVTGIVALMLAQNPALTAADIRNRLSTYAIDLGTPGRDNVYGHGLIDARNLLTQSLEPPGNWFVHLVNAATGKVERSMQAGAGGTFSFTEVPDGTYWLFAGKDDSGDGLTGLPMRRWGGRGAAADPQALVVNGADTYPATFGIGPAVEFEPNNSPAQASRLLANGYMLGQFTSFFDTDVYRVTIPEAGSYTFLAQGRIGACGFAVESDPVMSLFDGNGTFIEENDDADFDASNLCSSITRTLTPGDYLVQVEPFSLGRYVVSVRKN